jgi:type I restriction enzyme M protein
MPSGRPKEEQASAKTEKSTKSPEAKRNGSGANLGFEAQMFLAADKLRKNLEPSDYKHFARRPDLPQAHIERLRGQTRSAAWRGPCRGRGEYLAENVFWVPKEARWSHLQANARQPTIGKLIPTGLAGRCGSERVAAGGGALC